jgi:hypothetical protein
MSNILTNLRQCRNDVCCLKDIWVTVFAGLFDEYVLQVVTQASAMSWQNVWTNLG